MSADRRSADRVPVEMWVVESSARERYFQRSANLSVGGVYLENTIPHPRGTRVDLEFTLPGDTAPVKVKGEIVNLSESGGIGMGIQFVEMTPSARERIARFIAEARPETEH